LTAASQLPADAQIIALVVDDYAELTRSVLDTATEIGEQRGRTLLVGLSDAGRALDERLRTEQAAGLAEVLAGEAKLTDVAHRASDRGFLYLPVGKTTDLPAPSRLRPLLQRVRAADGTLLLVVPPGRAGLPLAWFDAEIQLGSEEAVGDGEAAPSGSDLADRWRRHRLKQHLPRGRTAIAAGALIALLGGWWILAHLVTAWSPDATSGALDAQIVDERDVDQPAAGVPVEADPPSEAVEVPEPQLQPDPVADAEAAPELRYSVLIASYGRLSDATRHLESAADPSILLFIAPTQVRGRLYYRLFGGALSSRASAAALMERLVESGVKDGASDWDVRPAALGFRLSAHSDAESARTEQRELAAKGVLAYLIPLVAEPDTVYQVYAGAYERPAATTVMRTLLADAGLDAELIPRRGEPR
jgi:cell division septation protein DedD